MGLTASKECKKISEEDLQEGSIPSTSILTSKTFKQDDLDPRSPSTHISRTPLQLPLSCVGSQQNESKSEISSTLLENTPAKLTTILLGIDPRSPTTEFKRTPIVINTFESGVPGKLCNKNLERVKRSTVITTPKSLLERRSNVIPPKLLESSPIRATLNANKRKSFVGLLETNIDYTETDLDEVIREKCKIIETQNNSEHSRDICIQNLVDPRSPTNEIIRTPIQIVKSIAEVDLIEEFSATKNELKQSVINIELQDHNIVKKCVQEICDIVHSKTEMTPHESIYLSSPVSLTDLYYDETDEELGESSDNTPDIHKSTVKCEDNDNIIVTEIKSAPITPPIGDDTLKPSTSTNTKQTKSAPVTPPVRNFTANVKELDKKLTSLIYQDEDIVICPRKVKLKDYDTRSPLRNLNSNEPEKKKSGQKLKIDDMKKSQYAVSKIPVFREKGKKTDVQCENTPPRNMERRRVKVNKPQWDNADTTLFI